MGRPRRQEPRRAQLIAATQRVLARDGLIGLRVREVAAEAGVSPASVLYYYPDSYQLAVQALRQAMHSCATERAAVAASVPDPAHRLVALIHLDIPETLPGIRRAFGEIPGQVQEHPELSSVVAFLTEDLIAVLQAAIADGVASGMFHPVTAVDEIAAAVAAVLQAQNTYRLCGLIDAGQARTRVIVHLEALLGCALPAGARTSGTSATSGAPGASAGSGQPRTGTAAAAPAEVNLAAMGGVGVQVAAALPS